MFRRLIPALLILLLAAPVVLAERAQLPLADYRYESWFLPQTPGLTAGPAGSLFNPAAWSMTDRAGMDFWWNDRNIHSGLDNYGFGFGRGLGFAMNTTTHGVSGDSWKIYDYQIGLSDGNRFGSFGVAYRWAHGETQRTPRQKALSMGFITRPSSWASFGASGVWSVESTAAQYVFDLGLRPFNKQWLTLFADWTANDDQAFFTGGAWGAGVEVRPTAGVHIGGKVRDNPLTDEVEYAVTFGLTWNEVGISAMPRFDQDGDILSSSFLVRANPPHDGLAVRSPLMSKPRAAFYPVNLENKILTYQKYRYFDNKHVAWLDLLPRLNILRDSPHVSGVVLNLAGFQARTSLVWELRQKLAEIQAAGKKVYIHVDRVNTLGYYLASVADHISMDPMGSISLPGQALSRSYLKGTLEKLGLGFQEHRYFKYKSAVEILSRDSMSEGDREQRQRIVDVIYEGLREGIADGRDLTLDDYDRFVDEMANLLPQEALAEGLIDDVGRWSNKDDWFETFEGSKFKHPEDLFNPRTYYDTVWGPAAKIPVVYAVGGCDMDTGIKGRSTSAYLRSLIGDDDVVAVVLRADSPGGDPLPSDLVADAVRQLKAAGKPVIISQGDVAASGGYWISMDGTEIMTTPLTITGSIGVISGWLYDDGLTAKAGITSESVQRGAHADLFAQVKLPFLGGIPRRAMDETELARVETVIRDLYGDFVKAVAKGRGLDEAAVHNVAQGRVWMGGDAIEHGLCDRFGTLDDALVRARELSGVPDWRPVEYVEYPPRPAFMFPTFMPEVPSLFGAGDRINRWLAGHLAALPEVTDADLDLLPVVPGLSPREVEYLRSLAGAGGTPLLMINPDNLPEDWQIVK